MGNSDALHNLGICYQDGKGVKQNLKTACKYYKLSADKGHSDALNRLGLCYYNGVGVKQDIEAAIKCYKLSANMGNQYARQNLKTLNLLDQDQKASFDF
uniref:Beta-lactamase n=1 Tax=Arcella intermedia TaxID=1963864 RepID=A0A6B2LT35_9EUKA